MAISNTRTIPHEFSLKALRKDTCNWEARALYSKKHPRYKRPNGSINAYSFATGDRNNWRKTLSTHNAQGKRIYFSVNDGGTKWADINRCVAHFFEYDDVSIGDYLARDWTTYKGGFFKTSADVFSGNRSPQGYIFLEEPYTNTYRWAINQIRINAFLDSDPSIYDPCRVMRAPGWDHTDDNGDPVRKSLLIRCQPELRYSIEEIEARLLEHEKSGRHLCVSTCSMRRDSATTPSTAKNTICGLEEIFGPGIREEFEEVFAERSKGSEHYIDGRSFEEIKAAFALIPPYETWERHLYGQ